MKRLRDALIITVLGGVVVWFIVGLVQHLHRKSVATNPTVQEAEIACLNDHMICHVGYDSFPSVASAEAYLKSPEHLAAVKARQQKEAEQEQRDKLTNCIIAAKGPKQVEACYKTYGTDRK